jgi:hypothetical protein
VKNLSWTIAYLKWPIYISAFKHPTEGKHRAINSKFFTDWVNHGFSKEKGYCKLLLEELLIWYAKQPTTKKRGSKSIEQVTGSIQTGSWQFNNSG